MASKFDCLFTLIVFCHVKKKNESMWNFCIKIMQPFLYLEAAPKLISQKPKYSKFNENFVIWRPVQMTWSRHKSHYQRSSKVGRYVVAKVYWRIKYTLSPNLEAKVYFSPKLPTWRLMCTLSPNLEAKV